MTGEAREPGILPRVLDVLFNTISEFQATKFVNLVVFVANLTILLFVRFTGISTRFLQWIQDS